MATTVKELIEKLQEYPEDMLVVSAQKHGHSDTWWDEINRFRTVEVIPAVKNKNSDNNRQAPTWFTVTEDLNYRRDVFDWNNPVQVLEIS